MTRWGREQNLEALCAVGGEKKTWISWFSKVFQFHINNDGLMFPSILALELFFHLILSWHNCTTKHRKTIFRFYIFLRKHFLGFCLFAFMFFSSRLVFRCWTPVLLCRFMFSPYQSHYENAQIHNKIFINVFRLIEKKRLFVIVFISVLGCFYWLML